MPAPDVPLWPDTVTVFYAERACAIRSEDTRKTWGYTYAQLQRRHPDKTLRDFNADDLVAFLTQQDDPGPRWAPTTVRAYRICLQSLFGWAHATGRVETDPTDGISKRVRIRPGRVRTPHWLTEAQIAALLATTDGNAGLVEQRDRIVLMLGIFTGLRVGEIGALRWRHVDLAADWLIFPGKGGRPDRLVLPPQLSDALAYWQDRVITEVGPAIADVPVALAMRYSRALRVPVVLDRHHGLGREGIRRIVRARGVEIGIPDLRPHDLRRTLAGTLDARAFPSKTSVSCSDTTTSRPPRPTSPTIPSACATACGASPSVEPGGALSSPMERARSFGWRRLRAEDHHLGTHARRGVDDEAGATREPYPPLTSRRE